jgi:hypothetical protein
MKINLHNIRESLHSESEEEQANGIRFLISLLEWKDQFDKESKSVIQDCVSAVTKIATNPQICHGPRTVRFFNKIISDDMFVLRERDISTLLMGATQSNLGDESSEHYKNLLEIINKIAFNQPSALVSKRDKLDNFTSSIFDNHVDTKGFEYGLETIAKLSSFDESVMPIAVRLFTKALEVEPQQSHPQRWTVREVAVCSLFRNPIDPEPEPWPVCFKLRSILSTIEADVTGRAAELLDYLFDAYRILHRDQHKLDSF